MLIEPTTYDLNELAEAAGVTTRTIRYYVSQGLLPSPATRGPGTRYDRGHLDRLQLIKRRQRQHLPLAEIRRQLESLDDAGVRELLISAPESPKPSNALSYVRELLGKEFEAAAAPAPMPTMSPPARSLAESLTSVFRRSLTTAASVTKSGQDAQAQPEPAPSAAPSPRQPGRSTWERVALSQNVELHVRRPLTREQNRQVDHLLDAARTIFAEEP